MSSLELAKLGSGRDFSFLRESLLPSQSSQLLRVTLASHYFHTP